MSQPTNPDSVMRMNDKTNGKNILSLHKQQEENKCGQGKITGRIVHDWGGGKETRMESIPGTKRVNPKAPRQARAPGPSKSSLKICILKMLCMDFKIFASK